MSTIKGADLLILAAYAPELVGLRETLGTGLAGVVHGVRVVCATVGVGLPAAGAGTMRHLREARPRAVILLGSCGAYPRRPAPEEMLTIAPLPWAIIGLAAARDRYHALDRFRSST